jgi:Pre-toxin TG
MQYLVTLLAGVFFVSPSLADDKMFGRVDYQYNSEWVLTTVPSSAQASAQELSNLINQGPDKVNQLYEDSKISEKNQIEKIEQKSKETETLKAEYERLAKLDLKTTVKTEGATRSKIDLSLIPDPDVSALPYQFQSSSSEIVSLYKNLYKVTPISSRKKEAKALGLIAIEEADKLIAAGEHSEAESYRELAEGFLDLVVGLDPVTGVARSTYELILGKNFVTGVELSSFERSLAFIGVLSVGTANPAAKGAKAVYKISGRIAHAAKELPAIKAAVREGTLIVEKVASNLSELKDAVRLLREHRVPLDGRRRVVKAFTPGSVVYRTTEDTKVYRYYVPGDTKPRGRWVTDRLVADPAEMLALKKDGIYEVKEWILPAGHEVIEGLISPNFGKLGGANQIYIPNPEILR